MAEEVSITVEFSGGLEILFDNQTQYKILIPSHIKENSPTTLAYLIEHLCEEVMRDSRKELFVLKGSIRPGILVLINDVDWELEGEEKYELKNGDNVLFVSTLHGG